MRFFKTTIYLLILLISFGLVQNVRAATEFVSTILESGGDYNTLYSWEGAINTDLTVSSTKVYSVSSSTGTVSDAATITGSVSSSTKAKVKHYSSLNSQVLVENIRNILTGTSTFSTSSNIVTGEGTLYTTELAVGDYIWLESSQTWQQIASIASSTQLTLTATSTIAGSGQSAVRGKQGFQSGEQLQVNGSNYVVISNTGDSAIAIAKIDGAWINPDTLAVTIDGWTTTSTNYIRIYTTPAARHNGTWGNGYRKTAYISISEEYVRVDGLSIRQSADSTAYFIANSTGIGEIHISNSFGQMANLTTSVDTFSVYSGGNLTVKLWNNIGINDSTSTTADAFRIYDADITVYAYNNTGIANYGAGFRRENGTVYLINDIGISSNSAAFTGIFSSVSYSASDDATADDWGGTGNKINQSFSFADSANRDFHLLPSDTAAKDAGTDLLADPNLAFTTDIDGQTRSGSWDIGADEFINTNPNIPVSLAQYQSDCSSSISTSTYWISTSTVCFQGKVSDTDVNDLEKLQIELSTSTFSNSPNYTASSFTTSTATSTSAAVSTSSVTVSSLPDGNYKWQARLLDYSNGTSSFSQFNSGNNSFGIDTTAPTGTIASSTFGTITSSSIIINRPSTSTITESGSGLYQWQARRNSSTTLSVVSTSTASTSDTGLTSNTQYTYDVRFTDVAGNISSYSATSSKYTLTPNPTNFSATPSQTSNNLSVDSFNNASSGSSGYYFSNTTNSNNSGWITTNSWTDTGLTCNTSYSYTIKYRNGDAIESATSSLSQTTSACSVSSAVANAGLPISILSSPKPQPKTDNKSLITYNQPQQSEKSNYQSSVISYKSFIKPLYLGLENEDVRNLQKVLSQYPDIYPEALITGYFGQLTKQAVQRLQIKYNIANQSDSAYGYVGPKTRKVLNLLEQINYLQNQLNQILSQTKKSSQ